MFCLSAGPVNAIRQLPPYFPTSLVGFRTSGSSGTRLSTGGSLPALTRSANAGASLNCLGTLVGSTTTSGRAVLGADVGWAAAAAAGLVGSAAAAGAAVGFASAGFGGA